MAILILWKRLVIWVLPIILKNLFPMKSFGRRSNNEHLYPPFRIKKPLYQKPLPPGLKWSSKSLDIFGEIYHYLSIGYYSQLIENRIEILK